MASFISPLDPPYDASTAEQLSILMSRSSREPLRLFRTMARHLPMLAAWGTLGAHNLGRGVLPVRDRELIILRTCFLNGCEYEWGVHVRIYGAAAGLTPEQLNATGSSAVDSAPWSEHDRAVLEFAESLRATSRLPEQLRAQLRQEWDDQQFLEACEVAGFYHGVSFIANVAEVSLEEWAARFPA